MPGECWDKYSCTVKSSDILIFGDASSEADYYINHLAEDESAKSTPKNRSKGLIRRPQINKNKPVLDMSQQLLNSASTSLNLVPQQNSGVLMPNFAQNFADSTSAVEQQIIRKYVEQQNANGVLEAVLAPVLSCTATVRIASVLDGKLET